MNARGGSRLGRAVGLLSCGLWVACSGSAAKEPAGSSEEALPATAQDEPANASSVQTPAAAPLVTPGPLSTYSSKLPDVEFTPALSPAARGDFQRSVERDLSRSLSGLPERSLGPRGRMVDVRDRFQHVVVQVRGQDGQLRTECLEDAQQLRRLLQIEGAP